MTDNQIIPIFQPLRSVGYICSGVPFVVLKRGQDTQVIVAIGQQWQIYSCKKLRVRLIGPLLHQQISCLAAVRDTTIAAVNRKLLICKRVTRVAEVTDHTGTIVTLLTLGDVILSLDTSPRLLGWRVGEWDTPQVDVQLPDGYIPTCMCHPSTYINKVLIGGQDGSLQLYNFVTKQCLFTFPGWGSAVQCLTSSPALDVVAVGLHDGRCVVHNILYDKQVTCFSHAAGAHDQQSSSVMGGVGGVERAAGGAPVSCMAFSTGKGPAFLAVGGSNGAICIWDLKQRTIFATLADAHQEAVVSLHFFAGQSLLMSAGRDNRLQHWLVDPQLPVPRLIRQRAGHSHAPNHIKFYTKGRNHFLLTSSPDQQLRISNIHVDTKSAELSQGQVQSKSNKLGVEVASLKLPPITCMDACELRERDWPNVVTCHASSSTVHSWSISNGALQKQELALPVGKSGARGQGGARDALHPTPGNAPVATWCSLTTCGNYATVGYANGRIDKYNMQSGLHRGTFWVRGGGTPAQQKGESSTQKVQSVTGNHAANGSGESSHFSRIVHTSVDRFNRHLFSVCSRGTVCKWSFKTCKLISSYQLKKGVGCLVEHTEPMELNKNTHNQSVGARGGQLHAITQLLVVICDDHVIRLLDMLNMRLVRVLSGHTDRITCADVSADCRLVISGSMDSTLRVWDIAAGQQFQVLQLPSPATQLAMSPTLDLLATCHVGQLPVYTWTNQQIFGSHVERVQQCEHTLQVNLSDMASGEASPYQVDSESDGDEGEGEGGVPVVELDMESAQKLQEQQSRMYSDRLRNDTPRNIAVDMVTLSDVPRQQWHSLLFQKQISERAAPDSPPKQPESAPFFLNTVEDAAGRVTFNLPEVGSVGQDSHGMSHFSRSPEHEVGLAQELAGGDEGVDVRGQSRVNKVARTESGNELVSELRKGELSADGWEGTVRYIRQCTSSVLYQQLVCMDEEMDVKHDLGLLLAFVEEQLQQGVNVELVQSMLRICMQSHGDVINADAHLAKHVARIHDVCHVLWSRLGGDLQNVYGMMGYFAGVQLT